MPKRIQRKRTKGWKMPAGTVYVGRPTKWGNPYRVVAAPKMYRQMPTRAAAMEAFIEYINEDPEGWAMSDRAKVELRGKDLACWCSLDQPCHADVLLELANAGQPEPK